jgi:hypothetical protein
MYMPLGGYGVLLGIYGAGMATALTWLHKRDALPERIGLGDTLLMGVATHKLTRIITKDWVTAPLRAPFTRYKESRGGGEVAEEARGTGMRKAVGDLLTCPFCTGPWVAGGLAITYALQPRVGRFIATILATTTVSDFLHRGYSVVGARQKQLESRSGER